MCTCVHLIPHLCLATIWEFKGAVLRNCIVKIKKKKKEMKRIYSTRKEILKYQFPILNLISIGKY